MTLYFKLHLGVFFLYKQETGDIVQIKNQQDVSRWIEDKIKELEIPVCEGDNFPLEGVIANFIHTSGVKCNCICHKQKGVLHIMACCSNGWKFPPREIAIISKIDNETAI